jgi:hypothetical protein
MSVDVHGTRDGVYRLNSGSHASKKIQTNVMLKDADQ